MNSPDRQIINAEDTLIIRSLLACGSIWTWEIRQEPRTFKEVQEIVDGLVDTTESVTDVWRVEKDANGIPHLEDISGMFDLRTMAEIAEQHQQSAERFIYNSLQRQYGTLNHAQQGLAR